MTNNDCITGDYQGNLIIYNFANKREEPGIKVHSSTINTIALSSDFVYALTGSEDSSVKVINLQNKALQDQPLIQTN